MQIIFISIDILKYKNIIWENFVQNNPECNSNLKEWHKKILNRTYLICH